MIGGSEKFNPAENMAVTEQGVQAAMQELTEQVKAEPSLAFLRQFQVLHPEASIYLVGGIIRDCSLGLPCKDFDFVIEGAVPGELERYLNIHGKIVAESDRATGVYQFIPEGSNEINDIAVARVEKYDEASRKPRVKTDDVSIEEDLARRDFTINAMAIAPFAGENKLIDPYGGIEDIQKRVIRAVGEPRQRFLEDPLRMMRAIRFACRFDFQIDEATFQAIKDNATEINYESLGEEGKKIRKVSHERISTEITGGLEADHLRFFDLMEESGLMAEVLPEIHALHGVEQSPEFHSEGDVWQHTRLVLAALPSTALLAVKLAALFHDIGKPSTFIPAEDPGDRIKFNSHDVASAAMVKEILKPYKISKELKEEVEWLVSKHMLLLGNFSKMRLSRQKELIRHPYFDDLATLTKADMQGSIPLEGKLSMTFLETIQTVEEQISQEIIEEKPLQVIRGEKVIELISEIWPEFDFAKGHGPYIKDILSEINDAYQDGDIKSEAEAVEKASQLILEKRQIVEKT